MGAPRRRSGSADAGLGAPRALPRPRGRIPSEELHALEGFDRLRYQAGAVFRRALVPDKSVTWAPNAIPAAIRIVKREQIDAVLTTSPPNSINLIGAAIYWRGTRRTRADNAKPA